MVIGIIVVVVLLAVLALFLYEMQTWHGPVISSLIMFSIIVVVISIGVAYAKSSPDLTTFMGFIEFVKFYFTWLGTSIKSTGGIVGNVINQDWGVNATTG